MAVAVEAGAVVVVAVAEAGAVAVEVGAVVAVAGEEVTEAMEAGAGTDTHGGVTVLPILGIVTMIMVTLTHQVPTSITL